MPAGTGLKMYGDVEVESAAEPREEMFPEDLAGQADGSLFPPAGEVQEPAPEVS